MKNCKGWRSGSPPRQSAEEAHMSTIDRRGFIKSAGGLALALGAGAPGIDFMWEQVGGLQAAVDSGRITHSWKAGPQTVALRRQLEAMPDGGVYALCIPLAPYRCPPGPYERACMVAAYFKQSKPKSKVLVLDANPDITSKAGLFRKAWADHYKGIVESAVANDLEGKYALAWARNIWADALT
jgi:sulfide dehydrogenase [flavocytochrome c] flavoprotein subunit